MRIDQAVDERRDPYTSSEAAARFLRRNYDALGSWPLAVTAYNHGPGGMRRAARVMGTSDIEVIIRRYNGPAFGFASRNFYVSFLAALDIEKNPEQYFGALRRQPAPDLLVVETPDYMRVDAIERAFGVTRSTLQAYNPALLPPVWEGAKYVPRGFRLKLPADTVIAAPAELFASVPPGQRFAAQVPDRIYIVKSGDTLSHIARRYRTSVAKLAQINGLTPRSRIRIGQKLKLPEGHSAAAARQLAQAPVAASFWAVDYPAAGDDTPGVQDWLPRQYNLSLSLNQVRPGTRVIFPRVERPA
jgi:membrane-bound lytic murein transglycosylase D